MKRFKVFKKRMKKERKTSLDKNLRKKNNLELIKLYCLT